VSVAAGLGNDVMALRARTASWMLVAVHLAILAIPPAITSFGLGDEPATGPAAVAVPLGVGVLALQLRHSFAIAHGRRPRGAWWTLGALAVLVYVPLGWFGWGWVAMQVSLMASLPIVLRRWPLAVALAAPILATDLAVVRLVADQPVATVAYWVIEQTFTLVVLSAALYGSARLVRVLDELQATRAELAELAVGRERLRVSRDLHDLLQRLARTIEARLTTWTDPAPNPSRTSQPGRKPPEIRSPAGASSRGRRRARGRGGQPLPLDQDPTPLHRCPQLVQGREAIP
jgi:signal transduction histidine kinase